MVHGDAARAGGLVNAFGYMLPFGFVSAPATAFLLSSDPPSAFMMANALGIVYGLAICSQNTLALLCVAFPLVALSRQLVYSSVFHFIGAEFGFSRYGTLLGIVNIAVASCGVLQYPLVSLSTATGSYAVANALLLVLVLPLFSARACLGGPPTPKRRPPKRAVADAIKVTPDETTKLVRPVSVNTILTYKQDMTKWAGQGHAVYDRTRNLDPA